MINKKMPARMAPPRSHRHGGALIGPITLDAAVVFTVSAVVGEVMGLAETVTEVGASEQLAPVIDDGSVQVKLMVPVKPAMGLTLMVEVPDWPGEEILSGVGIAAKLKLGVPAEMVMGTAAEVEVA
jgi:hypothetical protein